MNKEKMTDGIIIFLLIFPMSILFPWIYHQLFNSLAINSWFWEKAVTVATMVFLMMLLMPPVMSLKAKLKR